MPKKTKKEKILAEYRRKLKLLNLEHQKLKTQPKIKTFKIENEIKKNQSSSLLKDENQIKKQDFLSPQSQYVVQDIKKTAMITFLILVFEFLASFFYYKFSR